LIFVSFIIIFYSLLKSRVGESLALVGSLLLILAPHLFWHAQIAYTNLAYTSYLSLGALFLVNYYSNKNSLYTMLGMFLTGVSVWSSTSHLAQQPHLIPFRPLAVSAFLILSLVCYSSILFNNSGKDTWLPHFILLVPPLVKSKVRSKQLLLLQPLQITIN
ncbi:MAG: hypothetical protein LC127_18590, partial [Chitinophagales bacterium]|nr:hypothetical protein [Chitinophagales bacterium]